MTSPDDVMAVRRLLQERAGGRASYVVIPGTVARLLSWSVERAAAALADAVGAAPSEFRVHLEWCCVNPACEGIFDVTNLLCLGGGRAVPLQCHLCGRDQTVVRDEVSVEFEYLGGATSATLGSGDGDRRGDDEPSPRRKSNDPVTRLGQLSAQVQANILIVADHQASISVNVANPSSFNGVAVSGEQSTGANSKVRVVASGVGSVVEEVNHAGGETEVSATEGARIGVVSALSSAKKDQSGVPWRSTSEGKAAILAAAVAIVVALLGLSGVLLAPAAK